MPLSEEEQRQLEQMERALAADDPKFASALQGISVRAHIRRRILYAAAGFVLGIVVLMTGVITTENWVGVAVGAAGFVLMLASAYLALNAWRRLGSPESLGTVGESRRPVGPAARSKGRSASFMSRVEERWRRRRESGY